MPKLLLIFVIILLTGCKKEKEQPIDVNLVVQDTSLIENVDLENLDYNEFILDRNSSRKISGWIKYKELEEKLDEIRDADFSYFKSDKKVVETLIDEFSTTVPEQIDIEDINARILVVKNMYLKLNNTIKLRTSTKQDLKKSIKDLLEAFSNLNFQINKKFERDSQSIDKP